jgi:hypothetical protein
MRFHHLLLTGAASLTFLGCASTSRTAEVDQPAGPSWSGNLQPTQQRTGGLAVTGQTKAFGQVSISRAPGRLQRMHVKLTVSVPSQGAASYRWAVLPDRCGAGSLPLIGFDQFPLIDVSTNGRGQVDADLPLELTANGTYHVNVYDGGQQLDNVVTCANLRFGGE